MDGDSRRPRGRRRRGHGGLRRDVEASSISPSWTCRACRCSSLTSTWPCRKTCPATNTGSIAGSTIGAGQGLRPILSAEAVEEPRPCCACTVLGAAFSARPRRRAPRAAPRRCSWSRNTGRTASTCRASVPSQPVNGVALNCYDRLVRFKRVPLPDGAGHSFDMIGGTGTGPELAGGLRRNELHLPAARGEIPFRPARHGQGRQVVARPRGLDRRFRQDPDGGRLAGKAGAVRGAGRPDLPSRLHPQGQADPAEPGGHDPFRLRQGARA